MEMEMRHLCRTGLQKYSKLSGPLAAILFPALVVTQDSCFDVERVLVAVRVNKAYDHIY